MVRYWAFRGDLGALCAVELNILAASSRGCWTHRPCKWISLGVRGRYLLGPGDSRPGVLLGGWHLACQYHQSKLGFIMSVEGVEILSLWELPTVQIFYKTGEVAVPDQSWER